MAEIKSTLDIVMEKTKHLTLSKEEKKEHDRIEVTKRLKGLLQKYEDNLSRKEQLKVELERMKTTYDLNIKQMVSGIMLEDLKFGRDNKLYLDLLNEICGLDVSRLDKMFSDFQNTVEIAAEKRIKKLTKNLARKHAIYGSAIVPNLEADKEWQSILEKIEANFHKDLNKEKADFKGLLSRAKV
jgi:hypothetical protein